MSPIKHREEKMQEKRKHTPRREFVKEICSWRGLSFYKNNGLLSNYPINDRTKIISSNAFNEQRDGYIGTSGSGDKDFFQNLFLLFSNTGIPSLNNLWENINSDFSDGVEGAKNCYLSFDAILGVENIL